MIIKATITSATSHVAVEKTRSRHPRRLSTQLVYQTPHAFAYDGESDEIRLSAVRVSTRTRKDEPA